MSDGYPECVLDLYRSEVFGERISLAMLPWAKSADERYKLATVAQLETETKARLRPFLMKHGLPVDEEDVSAQVAELLPLLTAGSWRDFMTGMREDLLRFVARFEEIERLGPPEDREVLHSMVVHERALISFTERELAGQADSLADVIGQLAYPLPPPG
jgi:hypothetical protein